MRGFELSNMKLKGAHLRGVPLSGIGTPRSGGAAGLPPDIKAALVAWYSPKRSALNNFNVIESYADDFTTWSYIPDRGTLTRTPSKVVITEAKIANAIMLYDEVPPYKQITVRVTGATQENPLRVNTTPVLVIKKDGIYTIQVAKYVGFSFDKAGAVNVTIEQLPTSTLDDLSGNGHTLYLKGFKGKLGSGMGLYGEDFTVGSFGNVVSTQSEKTASSVNLIKNVDKVNSWFGYVFGITKTQYKNVPYKLRVKIPMAHTPFKFSLVSTDGNTKVTSVYTQTVSDGSIINIPAVDPVIFDNAEETAMYYDFRTDQNISVVLEQIPDYPDQLCHDGTCYGISYGQPILTDYTVVANIAWFDTSIANKTFASKRLADNSAGAFLFEKVNGSLQQISISFGDAKVVTFATGVSYQTRTSYNGLVLVPSTTDDSDTLVIGGSVLSGAATELWKGCYSDFMLFSRTLTPEEIEIVKKFIE